MERLIALLGHQVTQAGVARRIARLSAANCPQLVAVADGKVVGLCGVQVAEPIHREQPIGRITILAVDPDHRGTGIGRALVDAAERTMDEHGCRLVEATSNDRLIEAHRFYAHLGFDRTSVRFAKPL